MKCRECAAKAAVHVTEVQEGTPRAIHLYKEHARRHLGKDDLSRDLLRDKPCEIDVIARPWVEFGIVRVELLGYDVCTVDGEPMPGKELAGFLRKRHEDAGPFKVDLVASGSTQAQDFRALAGNLGLGVNSITTLAESG